MSMQSASVGAAVMARPTRILHSRLFRIRSLKIHRDRVLNRARLDPGAGKLLEHGADALCGDLSDIRSLYGQMAQGAASAGQQYAQSVQQGESDADEAIDCVTCRMRWLDVTGDPLQDERCTGNVQFCDDLPDAQASSGLVQPSPVPRLNTRSPSRTSPAGKAGSSFSRA